MRFECSHCLKLVAAQVEGSATHALRFKCSACDGITELSTASTPPQTASTPSEGQVCPKCASTIREGLEACPSCGLRSERFLDFAAPSGELSERLDKSWSKVEGDWSNEGMHEQFLREATFSGDYRAAAARYRVAAQQDERKAQAERMLARIQAMATAALLSSKPKVEAVEEPFRRVVMLLMGLVFLLAAGGVYLMMKPPTPAATMPLVTPGKKVQDGPRIQQRWRATPRTRDANVGTRRGGDP